MVHIRTISLRIIMVWEVIFIRNVMNRKPLNYQCLGIFFSSPFIFCCSGSTQGRKIWCKVGDWQKGFFLSVAPFQSVTVSRQSEHEDYLIVVSCKMWQRVLLACIFLSQVLGSCLFLAERSQLAALCQGEFKCERIHGCMRTLQAISANSGFS